MGLNGPRLAFSEDFGVFSVGPFGGLQNTDNPIMIPANMAQDLSNVDLSEGARSIKKREGYSLNTTLTYTTSPVHGIYNYKNSSGRNVSLFFNDRQITSSVNEGVSSVIYSSPAVNGATWDCDDYLGFAYCANTERTAILKTNGVSVAPLTVTSTGTMVSATHDRLAMAGVASDPSGVYFSKAYDFTNWTIGVTGLDPINFTITAPGAKITHITYAFGRLVWFKDSSFGYIIEGNPTDDDFSNWVIKTVSPNVGCPDNDSIYYNGILYFRGSDYHFYAFDGSNLVKLSKDINATVETMFSANGSWLQSTAEDFNEGSYNPNVYIDTTTSPGSISFNFPDSFSTLRSSVWKKYEGGSASGSLSVYNDQLKISHPGSLLSEVCATLVKPLPNLQSVSTFSITFNDFYRITPSHTLDKFVISISSCPLTTGNISGVGSVANMGITFDFRTCYIAPQSGTSLKSITSDGVSRYSNATSCSGTDYTTFSELPERIDIGISSTTYRMIQYTGGGELVLSGNLQTDGTGLDFSAPYLYMGYQKGSALDGYVLLDNFLVWPQTSTFRSQVYNIPSMSTWSAFTASYQDNDGSNTFYIRSSNTIFDKDATSPAWSSATNGLIPSISTGYYVQVRDDIIISTNGTSPTLSEFEVSWLDGTSPSDKSYAIQYDGRLYWSVVSGAGLSSNNKTLIYDLNNAAWLSYDFGTNGWFTKNNSLYFGSPTGGYVHKYGGAYTDNGSNISAYWKSKDNFVDNPFVEKEFVNMSFAVASFNNSYSSVTYTLNGSSDTVISFPMFTTNSEFTQYNKNLPVGKTGKTISVKIGNDLGNQPFEIFGIQVGYRPRVWKVTP